VIVYLTGGIGTGKSTVLRMLAELGARTVSADEIVRDLYADPAVQARVGEALGMTPPLDRVAIASVVFADAEARRRLEAIIHPLVTECVEALRRSEPADVPLVYEIPLPPRPQAGDVVIAITAPMEARLARLLDRGMSARDAEARIASQPRDDAYGKDARYTIVNDGDVEALRGAVDRIWKELQHGASRV